MDEAIRYGVPPEVARDFLLGHMNVNIGILFGFADAEISDGAKLMMERAKRRIFQSDWKKVFEPESVMEEIRAITRGASS
jgi:hypothetical protein